MFNTLNSHRSLKEHWLLTVLTASLLATGACSDDGGNGGQDPDAAPEPEAVAIDLARAEVDGTQVTVEGYVSVAAGTFESATGELGFAIQDESGGIYIRTEETLDLPVDTQVRVTGTLGDMNALRVVDAVMADIETLPGTQTVQPMTVATGDVNEDIEGWLVQVSGTLTRDVEDDSPYGLKVYIDDGSGEIQVFVHLIDSVGVIDTTGLATGSSIQVVGLVAQYLETYEVAPRHAADLVVQ